MLKIILSAYLKEEQDLSMNEMRMSKQHINNISRKINPANINSFDIKGLQSATVAMKYRRIQGMNCSFNNVSYNP